MPINVIIQLESAAQTVSVGEKASPFPLLSTGASVINFLPEAECVFSVLNSPKYDPLAVDIVKFGTGWFYPDF